jgi:hypothetical protein
MDPVAFVELKGKRVFIVLIASYFVAVNLGDNLRFKIMFEKYIREVRQYSDLLQLCHRR